jgi:hypothetical protein
MMQVLHFLPQAAQDILAFLTLHLSLALSRPPIMDEPDWPFRMSSVPLGLFPSNYMRANVL